jgi:hypothetical protein
MREFWRSVLLCAFVLVGVSFGLHFSLHSATDIDTDGPDAPAHQCPSEHFNTVHSPLRDALTAIDRVTLDTDCSATITFDDTAPRYFDEAPAHVLVSAHYASVVGARGPPALT